MEIVKGESASIEGTTYSYWSGEASTSTVANITGATIQMLVKRNYIDADNQAVITKSGSVVSGAAGTLRVTLAASDTNSLTEITTNQVDWYYEIIVKLVDGTTYIRSGVGYLTILPHLIKTLP